MLKNKYYLNCIYYNLILKDITGFIKKSVIDRRVKTKHIDRRRKLIQMMQNDIIVNKSVEGLEIISYVCHECFTRGSSTGVFPKDRRVALAPWD